MPAPTVHIEFEGPEGVQCGFFDPSNRLPLIIVPGKDSSKNFLVRWGKDNKKWLDEQLLTYGAILFRGFAIKRPYDFEEVGFSVNSCLQNRYLGTSPRQEVTAYTFTASEVPPLYPIPQHIEMSFINSVPERLLFCCIVEPKEGSGQTTLSDAAKILRDVPADVRKKFEQKGVYYVRRYKGPSDPPSPWWDPLEMKRWDEVFGTTDKSVVEESSREDGVTCHWDKGSLMLENTRSAIAPHPETGEKVWFNHSQVFHPYMPIDEYRRIFGRTKQLTFLFMYLLSICLTLLRRIIFWHHRNMSLACLYGDRTEIPSRDLKAVNDAVWKNKVYYDWKQGDVCLIDNFKVTHGRMPFRGQRCILVAWGKK